MTVSLQSPEDVVNAALTRIGYKMRITNMFDGSLAANAALNIYGQTRDELLRQSDWAFAQRNLVLTLLKSAPVGGYIPGVTTWSSAYPPIPWLYEYTYPADCLKVRAVKYIPMFVPNFDPQPHPFGLDNDNSYTPAVKVILSNVPGAFLVYTGRVTDPTTWEADFSEAMAAALGRRLMLALAGPQSAQLAVGDEGQTKVTAEVEQG